jgi:hypothetical protein
VTDDELLTPVPVLRLGRRKTNHRARVLIEGNRVVIRTRCGLDPLTTGFTETFGFPSCDSCEAEVIES